MVPYLSANLFYSLRGQQASHTYFLSKERLIATEAHNPAPNNFKRSGGKHVYTALPHFLY